jgi:hypothetical protein
MHLQQVQFNIVFVQAPTRVTGVFSAFGDLTKDQKMTLPNISVI